MRLKTVKEFKMHEPLRIFGILLYKSWMIRKKYWILGLSTEILLPLIAMLIILSIIPGSSRTPEKVETDHLYNRNSLDTLLDIYMNRYVAVYYAPRNKFTGKLMFTYVYTCFKGRISPFRSFRTESDLITFHHRHPERYIHAVIFDESVGWSTKHLSYKLRKLYLYSNIGRPWPLYNNNTSVKPHSELFQKYILHNRLAQLQICLDRSFVNLKSGNKPIPDMHIQRMPYPGQMKEIAIPYDDRRRMVVGIFFLFYSMIPLAHLIQNVMAEKASGMNVLMSAYGISSTPNLLSWITSEVLFYGVLLYIPIVIYLCHVPGNTLSYIHYGNPLFLYLFLTFNLAHILSFGIHISAYFTRDIVAMIVLGLLLLATHNLRWYGFNESTRYLVPYIGVVFPYVLMQLTIEEINAYESKAEGIHWYNLFANTNPAIKAGGSVGMILILSVIGIIFHSLLSAYIYAISPGKFGVAKHPLYFLNHIKNKKNKNNDEIVENINNDDTSDLYFEPAPEDVFIPGIQMRNLKKSYIVNLFTKQKCHALRDVSIDFYKGQITSLLGHNGAGKTTLISILSGISSPTEGTVLIDSKNLKMNESEIKKNIGLCMQENICFPSLTVFNQLLFFTMVKRKDQSQTSSREEVEDLLEKLELHDSKDVLPDKLSEGQKRRLCLGIALAGDASTLMLDEPTSGLDPESRRVIWNVLLKIQGQKTILISTRNMEEAEILGDRIAILHEGQVKSYGTLPFLKRLIGQNDVEITLSTGPRSDPEKIRNEISKEGIIVNREANHVIVRIPNSPRLPDTLDNLEKRKKELGVTSFTASFISLEHVFIKVTEENDGSSMPQQTVGSNEAKWTGHALRGQTVPTLFSKKLTCALSDHPLIIKKLFTLVMALLVTALYVKSIERPLAVEEPVLLPINLKMYHEPDVLYKSEDRTLGDIYKSVSRSLGSNPIEVTNNNLESELLQRGNNNPILYDKHSIAAAEINKTCVNALYSDSATYSLPISINLLSNTILKNLLGSDYSITMSYQAIPYEYTDDDAPYEDAKIIFISIFCLTVAMFVVYPSRERNTRIKHLQMMTGVSGLSYWSTTLLFDLIEYSLLVVLVVIGFLFIDLSLGLEWYGSSHYISMEILLFMLFGISTLPFIYLFSLIQVETNQVLCAVMSWTTGLLVLDFVLASLDRGDPDKPTTIKVHSFLKWIFRLIPCVSFSHCQLSFFKTVDTNARCRRLTNDYIDEWCHWPWRLRGEICCELECYDGKCKKPLPLFGKSDEGINLKEGMICLCITAVIYFGLLVINESRFCAKAMAKENHDPIETNPDEQVQQEKSMIFEHIETLRGNKPSSIDDGATSNVEAQVTGTDSDNKMFMVYELKRDYGEVKVVRGVSFSVNRRECFLLLGANAAGKSATFRMMTGEEVPNHGIMYLEDKEFEQNFNYCLSQIGYCPQQNAILKRLNACDHLRLFARLRGIPEKDVENQVETWIKILNLNAYALQPSGTYSAGNMRRLSIGIALIGNPNLILIDEPTTGVDPGTRHLLWNVIKARQMDGHSVVLTSQSMVECEALSDRLAVMVDGKLVCIGASSELNQRVGVSYEIKIKMDHEKATDQVDSIKNDMAQKLSCELTDENISNLLYRVTPAGTTWRKMYDMMNEMKSKYDCIVDFSVLSSSMDQLFVTFARSASSDSTT